MDNIQPLTDKRIRNGTAVRTRQDNAQSRSESANGHSAPLVAIVGNPNVGKSVLFNRLTGSYVTVSNYPGTTVEISRGSCRIGKKTYRVVDTPGMYGLTPITDDERVARSLLLSECPDLVLHVVDAKNLQRMLPLTLQLIEAGFNVILVLNLMDELESAGLEINVAGLRKALGVSVVPTICLRGRGIAELKEAIHAGSGCN